MITSLIESLIKDFINGHYNLNFNGNRIFDEAIIGISSGDDSLYKDIKADIGEFYWTPQEAFRLAYPEVDFKALELKVVSWILPFTEETKISQYSNKQYPSVNWVNGRIEGEKFNEELRRHLINSLRDNGIMAVAPCIMEEWGKFISKKYGYASSWSERHAAYISGLGTFGLCDGLITKVGKAHRCGSIIILADIEITKRVYSNYHEYCLFYNGGSCKACIERCPIGAISEKGHNKMICKAYQRKIITEYIKKEYELESSCCGLCQTNVPCESKIPY